MHSDRVDDFVRRMAEIASQLSELEYLKRRIVEAQQRALASTIPSSAMMKVPPKFH